MGPSGTGFDAILSSLFQISAPLVRDDDAAGLSLVRADHRADRRLELVRTKHGRVCPTISLTSNRVGLGPAWIVGFFLHL